MAESKNDKRESNPEITVTPSPERTNLMRQRESLILFLVKMGFRQLTSDTTVKPMECVFMLKDSAQGKEKMGVRIFIPEEDDHLRMALLGNTDENSAIVRAINEHGFFSATKDIQERGAIGENYDVTMVREPEVTKTKIKYMSLGTSNRIWALIKRVITG